MTHFKLYIFFSGTEEQDMTFIWFPGHIFEKLMALSFTQILVHGVYRNMFVFPSREGFFCKMCFQFSRLVYFFSVFGGR